MLRKKTMVFILIVFVTLILAFIIFKESILKYFDVPRGETIASYASMRLHKNKKEDHTDLPVHSAHK